MDGIIFDLDGTLWDSVKEVEISWNMALAEKTTIEKRVDAESLQSLFGKPLEEIMDIVFPELNKEEKEKITEILLRYENEWVETAPCKLYEGMLEGIPKLAKKYPVFIVSNCQKGYIEAFLKNTKLGEYITDHTCPGDTGMLKAENIKLIMERNHLKDVVYVGDTAGDEAASNKAGVPFIHASYGFGTVKNPAAVIKKFEELHELDYEKFFEK